MKVVWMVALITIGMYLLIFILDRILMHNRKKFVTEMDAKIATTMENIHNVERQIEIYEVELVGLPDEIAIKAKLDYQRLKDELDALKNRLINLKKNVCGMK